MKILVTGASGFIGSNFIIELLSDTQNQIFGLCRKPFEPTPPRHVQINADLSSPSFIKSLPGRMDAVVHLAQSREYKNFPESANDIFAVNVHSTQLLLEWARHNGVSKFIYASTGNVYKQQNRLLTEDDPCEPQSYYGASKLATEQIIAPYRKFFEIRIARIFGAYGLGQTNMTIPAMIELIRRREGIDLANGVGLYFTPLYISDLIQMLLRLLFQPSADSRIVYNLAGNEAIDLGSVVKTISAITEIPAKTTALDAPPSYLLGDASTFVREYGYTPQVSLLDGLSRILRPTHENTQS